MARFALVAPCVFALACGPAATLDQLDAAVPSRDVLSVALPPPPPVPAATCATLGPATFGQATHDVSATVDGVLDGVLGMADQLRAQPPSAQGSGEAMWGPIQGDASEYMFAVQQQGGTAFNFFLGGQAQGAQDAWQGVFGGSSDVIDAQHRSGEVDVNFGVMHDLDGTTDPISGGAAVVFAIDDDGRRVNAHFGQIVSAGATDPTDNDYAFIEAPDHTVSFAFSTKLDFDGGGVADERVHIDSKWAADGSGVAHVTITDGSLGSGEVHAVECWDGSLARTYAADDRAPGVEEGSAACCPF